MKRRPKYRDPGRRPVPIRGSTRGAKPALGRAAAAIGHEARAVTPDEILDLQRSAGNHAVTLALQRNGKDPVDSNGMPVDRAGIPKHGPDVRAGLRERMPGLLGALSAEQLDRWQAVVDWHYIEGKLRSERYKNDYGYLGPQTGFPQPPSPTTTAIHEADPEYQKRKRELDAYERRKRPAEEITVDPRLLLSDDVHQQPEWDVKAEMEFREWAIAEVTKAPIKLDVVPSAAPYEALAQWPTTMKNTKGFITADDLRQQYSKQYSERVSNRLELREMQKLLGMLRDANIEMRIEHQERSDINARKIGFGIVRHISEAVGSGSTPYPSIKMWDKADLHYEKAITAFNRGQYELAVPLMSMAEAATADAVSKYVKYEKRVTSGAGRVITVLEAFKTAGTIAAGVASGGLGLTGAALVAGGYQAAQEGAQRASEMYYGQRTNFGLADLLKKAGVTSIMTLMGGPLQARFQVALKARVDLIPSLANSWFGKAAVSSLASATSSVYMTAAEVAIKEIISGDATPKSATEFADLIVDNAVQSVVMDAATNRLNSRAAREYAAWKAGRGTSTVSTSAFKHQLDGSSSPLAAPAAKVGGQAGRTVPVETVRAMLNQGAGWRQQVGGLEAGVGLGAGLPVAERRALIAQFEAYRTQVAQNVGTVFGGEVAVRGPADEHSAVEVRFSGPEAAKKVSQAEAYLDAKSPGWRKQTEIKITEAAPTASPAASAAGRELQIRMGASISHLAAEFVPIFDKWPTLTTPQARADAMLAVVNRELVAAGSPPLRVKVVADVFSGQLITQKWEIHISPEYLQSTDMNAATFAKLCEDFAHEGRHALQFWRMARIDPARSYDLDPIVKLAAEDANAGNRPAEQLDPASLKYKEAQEMVENVYGANADKRNEILTDMKTALQDMTAARTELQNAAANGVPLNDPVRMAAQQKYDAAQRMHDDAGRRYLAFAEEIDARQVGDSTAAAVKERLGRRRALENAQAAEREAHATYERAMKALTDGDFKYRMRLEKRQQLLKEALAAWKTALEKMQRYEQNLANLTKPKAGAKSGADTPKSP